LITVNSSYRQVDGDLAYLVALEHALQRLYLDRLLQDLFSDALTVFCAAVAVCA
jgi:hypothetical protein